ncbi:MAG TPA: peptidylprolyl isomerase [Terriglobales bacterium]|nr:peptidylprolyl isomerase [Terriglobales bacterium]
MKRTLVLILAATFAAAACSPRKEAPAKMAAGTPAYQLAKDLAASVPALDPEKNPVIVTAKTFDVTTGEVLQWFLDRMGPQAQGLKSQDPQRVKGIIEQEGVQLGERKLLYAAAVAAKKTPAEDEVKKALEAQYARAGGEAQFLETLKTNGVGLDFVRKSIAEDMAIRRYLEGAVAPGTKVAEADVRKAYAEDKTASVRHILLLTQGRAETEKAAIRKKMEDILARAKKGEDFAALAKEYSEDPGSKANGGLYEDFGRGKMVKPFEDAAFSVPVGQVSGIVETKYGYHILKVENRKKETRPFDQAKAEIEAGLKQGKENAAFDALLTTLKEKAGFKAVPLR